MTATLDKQALINERMQEFVAANDTAGSITAIINPEKIIHLGIVGQANIEKKEPMRPDTIFWIASMTKLITATSVMMLHSEGKLSPDDLVSKYIPEFSKLKTPSGKNADLTIRHILTHTSGLSEATLDEARVAKSLSDLIPTYLDQTTLFEPGSKWQYCQSSINTAGRIVEIVSGMNFSDFITQKLFVPLGMKDTTLYLPPEKLPRLAASYRKDGDKLVELPRTILEGHSPIEPNRYPPAHGGLFSTAYDYSQFCRMMLHGGELDGKRYLKPESFKLMTTLQSGDVVTGFSAGCGWGLGWCLALKPQGISEILSPGSFGHGGAFGTQVWIDPKKKLAYLLLLQRSGIDSDNSPMRAAFQQAAAAALA